MATTDSNAAPHRAARRSPGGIVTADTKTMGTSFGARFRAFGKRQFVHLGYSAHGYGRNQAEAELAYITEQVRRGEWVPPAEPEPAREMLTFHVFASQWFEARKLEGGRSGRGLSPSGEADLRWRLSNHLLPAFAHKRLDQIVVADVDAFRRANVAEGLSPTSVNKMLATLSAVLEQAREYGHVERNVAAGKRRRLPAVKPGRSYLDNAAHIEALLGAAAALDLERDYRTRPFRKALLATLTFAGLRIDEALSLRWRHLDLAGGRLRAQGSKTENAERWVPMLPALRDELLAHAARRRDGDQDAYVFETRTGGKLGATNVRRRILSPAVERANERLAEQGSRPLPEGLTPHSLRRTCASLLVALGWDPARVMRALGHTTPEFTLSIYAASMDWTEGEAERLRALVEGDPRAVTGTSAAQAAPECLTADPAKSPDLAL
jgi:integrase